MARWTRFVLHHRKLVMLFWLLAFVGGGVAAGQLSKQLSFSFSLPGQPGHETALKLLHTYGNGGEQPPAIAVVTAPAGQSVQQDMPTITKAFDGIQQSNPQIRTVDFASTHDAALITRDGRSTYAIWYIAPPAGFAPPGAVKPARELAAALPGYHVRLSGLDALASSKSSKGPGVLAETLIGGLGALAVLAFVFASFLALIPLVVAAVSITTTLLIVLLLTTFADVSFIVQYLVAVIGLGVAIDYSLLIVTRWREERAHLDNHDAVVHAMQTAGKAVVFSGGTVAIGLFALVFLPVPFLRSIGYGGMLIPLISVAVSLTLLPALLGGIGPRIDWPRLRHEDHASRPWTRWASWVVRRRWIAAGIATAILVALFIPFLSVKIGLASSNSLAKSGPAYDALHDLRAGGAPDGVLTPIEVLTRSGGGPGVVAKVAHLPGIATAMAPSGPPNNRAGTSVVTVLPTNETVDATSVQPVTAVKNALKGDASVIGVTGVGALQLDYKHAVYDNFPYMLAIIVVITFVLLARAFRSVLLPLKAVLLNLLSLSATFGAVVLFWQEGHGSQALFGIAPTGAITFWMPIMIFAFLFGLSMDYEVFILARMREEYDRTGSTSTAVVTGIGRTGRLVTSAALILFLTFASLASGPQTDIKVFATALGAGILLDATVVRALLVPALVALFGKWNWWLPGGAAKALRVEPSPIPRPRPEVEEPVSA